MIMKLNNKIIFSFLFLLLVLFFGTQYFNKKVLYKDSDMSLVGFIVEPKCENQVKEYFTMLSKNDHIEAEVFPINYTRGVFDHIKQYALIRSSSNKDSFKDMEAYVNGALSTCVVVK